MRIVLDTNVVVSALISTAGAPASILAHWERHDFELTVSEQLLQEYQRALQYGRAAVHHRTTPSEVTEFVSEMRQFSVPVVPQESIAAITEDPADNRVLECAAAGGASYIVSGDRHLLRLREYRGIPILSQKAFLTVLGEEGT